MTNTTAAELEEDLAKERDEHAKTKAELKDCIAMLSQTYGLMDNVSTGLIANLAAMSQLKQQILEVITKAKQR